MKLISEIAGHYRFVSSATFSMTSWEFSCLLVSGMCKALSFTPMQQYAVWWHPEQPGDICSFTDIHNLYILTDMLNNKLLYSVKCNHIFYVEYLTSIQFSFLNKGKKKRHKILWIFFMFFHCIWMFSKRFYLCWNICHKHIINGLCRTH